VIVLVAQVPFASAAGAPGSVAAGPFEVTPTLGVEAKNRSNIYRRPTDETSATIYRLTPAIEFLAQERVNTYSVSYSGDYGYYQNEAPGETNDYQDHRVNAAAHIEPTSRWAIDIDAGWGDIHEDRGTGLSEGAVGQGIDEPVTYEQLTAGAMLTYGTRGSSRVQGLVRMLDKEYQNFRAFTQSRDYDQRQLGANFFYPVAAKTDVTVQYVHNNFEYPFAAGNLPSFDSAEDNITAGAEWEASAGLTSSARVGWFSKDFDDSGREDQSGLSWMLDLQLQPTERTQLYIRGQQAPTETTLVGDFIDRRQISVDLTQKLGAFMSVNVRASLGEDVYEGSVNDRTDDLVNAGVRINYTYWRQLPLYLEYSYEDKDSSNASLSYTDNTIAVGFLLSL
jgi:hypothetical protein